MAPAGQINLGTAQLSQDTLAQYQTQLAAIGNALSDTGDLLLYGCNVAEGEVGQAFVSALASATGADVAASTDLTGGATTGGDWVLEATSGQVEASSIEALAYEGSLPLAPLSTMMTEAIIQAGLSLSMRAYSTDYLGDAKAAAANAAVSTWQASDLGAPPDSHVLRCDVGNASATAGLCTIDGKKVLGIGFEGTNFGTQWLDLWDDLVNIDAHAEKLSGFVQELMDYAAISGVQQILFAGHSLGGGVAQYYCDKYAANDLVCGVTFGSPGALSANALPDDRLVNFRHTADLVPVVGEYGLSIVRTISDAVDAYQLYKAFATGGLSLVAEQGLRKLVDSLLLDATLDAGQAIADWLGFSNVADVYAGLDFAIHRLDYVVDGTDVVIDYIRPNDGLIGIAEHTLNDPTSETSYAASLQTYLEYAGLVGNLRSGYYQIGTPVNDDLQTGQVTVYTPFYGFYDASLGGSGNDEIGRHTLTSNDSEANIMAGGAGDDTYYVDNVYDQIVEAPGTDGGLDTARSRLNNYTLAANVENLILEANNDWYQVFTNDDINGTGNTLNNIITGNNGDNTLDGLEGNDSLAAGKGKDTLLGGSGDDILIAIDGYDILQGGSGNDQYWVSRVDYDPLISIYIPTYDITDMSGNDYLCISDIAGAGASLNGIGDLNFQVFGNDLIIDLDIAGSLYGIAYTHYTDDDEGRITLHGLGLATSQIETLFIFDDNGYQIGNGISLQSIYSALGTYGTGWNRLTLSDSFGLYGQLVTGSNGLAQSDGGTVGNDATPVATPSISVDDVVVGESQAYADFVVRLNAPGTNTVTVNYETSSDTASSSFSYDYQYQSGILNFAPGEMVKTVRVPITDDVTWENTGSFTLQLNNASNATIPGNDWARATIIDNDAAAGTPVVTINGVASFPGINDLVIDEATKEASFVITLDRPSTGVVSMNYTTQSDTALAGLDYVATSGTLSFAPGETARTVKVALINDTTAEPDEAFNFVLSGLSGATAPDAVGTAVIAGNDATPVATPSISVDDVVVSEGTAYTDTYADFVVRLNAPGTNTVTVNYQTNDGSASTDWTGLGGDYQDKSGILNFAPGEMVKTVRVPINNDVTWENTESFILELYNVSNATIPGNDWARATIIDNDASMSVSSVDYTLPASTYNLTLTGTAAINGVGNALNNALIGNTAANTLDGGAGADALIGGLGNDTYVVGNTGDVIVELRNEGADTVQSSVSYTLSDNVENLTLTGTANISGSGNALDNIITGNSGANVLSGGAGNDTYVVDNTGDVVTENASAGTDLVQSAVTYTLAANVENLTLTGTAAINGTGNTLNNALTGNSGNNFLDGGAGNDTLVGDAGNDTFDWNSSLRAGDDIMYGGSGDDAYVMFGSDQAIENPGEGVDTIYADLSYSLASLPNVENLTLFGTAAINGIGNALDNVLIGNAAANMLDGGEGADTLTGGAGNDTYVVDNTDDVVTENANEGTDLVQSAVTYTLAANVENLTLTGTATINGTGNTLNNALTGNSGNNFLDGGAGNDTLTGGTGNDTFQFAATGNGSDVIMDFTLGDHIRVTGAAFATGLLSQGTGTTLLANQAQVSADGLHLYIGTNATAGADIDIRLNTAMAGQWQANGDALFLNSALIGGVVVSGSPTQGASLVATNTLSDADGLGTLLYQWQSSSDGISWSNVGTDATLVLTEALVGRQIKVLASFTDGYGITRSVESSATATVVNVNDAPTLAVPPAPTFTDTSADNNFTNATGNLVGSDVDAGTTLSYGISGGTVTGGVSSKAGSYGTLRVTSATGAWSFAPNDAAIEALKTSVSEDFTVTVGDGTASASQTLTINLAGANDAPVVTCPAVDLTIVEDGPSVQLFAGLSITDLDDANLQSVTLLIGCNSHTDATRNALIGTTFSGKRTTHRYSAETFCHAASKRSL